MDTNLIRRMNFWKVGAATILSVGILGACADVDNDDVDVNNPVEDVDPNDNTDTNVDIDADDTNDDTEVDIDADTDADEDDSNN